MLRRPPTVLTLTADDLKAYEDRHEAEVFKAALAAQKQTFTPKARHPQDTTATSFSSSSSYADISDANNGPDDEEDEDSYYPRRYRTIDDEDDGHIYRNEVEASPSSNATSAAAEREEDQVMAELAPDELVAREASAAPVSRFGRRAAALAVTPTPGVAAAAAGRGYGTASVATPEAPARQTRSREERIVGRGGRR